MAHSPDSIDPSTSPPPFFDRDETARLIEFPALVESLRQIMIERTQGLVASPDRIGVPLNNGGVSLSMPASATDISIHKLVNVAPGNSALGLPTIHGIVTVCDAQTGRPTAFLDGPEVTGRRTAGVSLVAINTFLRRAPAQVLLIGTGSQSRYHVAALRSLYPSCQILVRGVDKDREQAFCLGFAQQSMSIKPCPEQIPASVEVVITLTTSKQVVYDEIASAGRLVIGLGAFTRDMAELGAVTLHGSDVYVDDLDGARHEAGDLIRANVDWTLVHTLTSALGNPLSTGRPVVVKSVGAAAWDLAAARVAMDALKRRQ